MIALVSRSLAFLFPNKLDVLAVVGGVPSLLRLRVLRAKGLLPLRAWIELVADWGQNSSGRYTT